MLFRRTLSFNVTVLVSFQLFVGQQSSHVFFLYDRRKKQCDCENIALRNIIFRYNIRDLFCFIFCSISTVFCSDCLLLSNISCMIERNINRSYRQPWNPHSCLKKQNNCLESFCDSLSSGFERICFSYP